MPPPALATSYAMFQQYLDAFHGTDQSQEDAINGDLAAVSNYINEATGRFFGREPEATERSYRPVANSRVLYVDDMGAAPDSVLIDGTALAEADYELWPLNAAQGPRPKPYRGLHRPGGAFSKNSLVVVECRWGWPAIPGEIVRATIEITGILRRESPRATSRYDEGIAAFVSESTASKQIVDRLVAPFMRAPWTV